MTLTPLTWKHAPLASHTYEAVDPEGNAFVIRRVRTTLGGGAGRITPITVWRSFTNGQATGDSRTLAQAKRHVEAIARKALPEQPHMPLDEVIAYRLGMESEATGTGPFPLADPYFARALGSPAVGESTHLLKAWSQGWTASRAKRDVAL